MPICGLGELFPSPKLSRDPVPCPSTLPGHKTLRSSRPQVSPLLHLKFVSSAPTSAAMLVSSASFIWEFSEEVIAADPQKISNCISTFPRGVAAARSGLARLVVVAARRRPFPPPSPPSSPPDRMNCCCRPDRRREGRLERSPERRR